MAYGDASPGGQARSPANPGCRQADWRSCFLGCLPNLFVLLTNLDVDRAEVPFTDGATTAADVRPAGDWRSPIRKDTCCRRVRRWNLRGGNLSRVDTSIRRILDHRIEHQQICPHRRPGKYKLRVLYHDHVTIADCDDVAGLIVSVSLPMDLTVEPIAVEATRGIGRGPQEHFRVAPQGADQVSRRRLRQARVRFH